MQTTTGYPLIPGSSATNDRVVVDRLAAIEPFNAWSRRDRRRLANVGCRVLLDAGQEMIRKHDRSQSTYVILTGSAMVHDGDQPIGELGPGDVVGELEAILDQPRRASVSALTPLEALRIPGAALQSATGRIAPLAWLLGTTATHRVARRAAA